MTVLDLEVRSNRATLNSAETKSVPVDRLETFVRTRLGTVIRPGKASVGGRRDRPFERCFDQ